MNNYDYIVKKINENDLLNNTIYWLGTDTQGRSKYGTKDSSWKYIYNYLIYHQIMNNDDLFDKYYNQYTETLDLPDDFDYKNWILNQNGNAYYQFYIETDSKGKITNYGGDINWFPIYEDALNNKGE